MLGLDVRLGTLPQETRFKVASAAQEAFRPYAAAYYRVSTDKTVGKGAQTIEHQRPEVLAMLVGRGFRLWGEYYDEISGSKGADERPGLRSLQAQASRASIKAVFTHALDRISRDDTFTGGLLIVGEFDRLGVDIFSHQEPELDATGPFRQLYLTICMKVAADQRRKIQCNTQRSIDRIQANIKEFGGYRSPRTGRMITKLGRPSKVSPEVVAAARKLRTENPAWTWGQVLRELQASGVASASLKRQTLQSRVEADAEG